MNIRFQASGPLEISGDYGQRQKQRDQSEDQAFQQHRLQNPCKK
jgi:hypothetical protein